MNSTDLKKLVTESVLNFLNDASHWNDLHNIFDIVPELPDKEEPKPTRALDDKSKKMPLFLKKGDNTFGLDKKEN